MTQTLSYEPEELIRDYGRTLHITYCDGEMRCENCVFDTINGCSTGFPKDKCPLPFPHGGSCPVCKGKGTLLHKWSPTTIKVIPYANPDGWFVCEESEKIKDRKGIIQVWGFGHDVSCLYNSDSFTLLPNQQLEKVGLDTRVTKYFVQHFRLPSQSGR